MTPFSFPLSFSLRRSAGFTLVEVMIALALGLLLSVGIMTLFSSTSQTNKLQQGMSRLQENGRFALGLIEKDLRMTGAMYCSTTTGTGSKGTAVPMMPARAMTVYAPDLKLPDSVLNSIAGGNPSSASATASYDLSPRWFTQGYSCDATSCTPALPTGAGQVPVMGLENGKRVPSSDVLTVRYQRGSGWPIALDQCMSSTSVPLAGGDPLSNGATITVSPQLGDDPFEMEAGLAVLGDCVNPSIVPITSVDTATNILTIGVAPGSTTGILPDANGFLCRGSRIRDVRLFDFSKDFVTVTWYLAFRKDDSPDARSNTGGTERLIPVLIRRVNGAEQEIIRGVDQLTFKYGVQLADGKTQIMEASDIQSGTNCAAPPPGMTMEPGCLWRSVRSIEPRLLVNSVDEVFTLDSQSRQYRFNGGTGSGTDDSTLASGLTAGSMLRREFIGYAAVRNHNF